MSDLRTSKDSLLHFAESWDQQVREAWPETFPESLSNALKALNVSSILDCAGGTGFPIIELKQMGWDVSYSDGSETLVALFKKSTETNNLEIPIFHSRWETLTEFVPKAYDALLCSGNSFVSINSYETDSPLTASVVKQNMQKSVEEFYQMLNTGGVLYIDLFNKESAMPKQPYSEEMNGDKHRSFITISYDPVRNVRTNLTTTTSLIDNSERDLITKLVPILSEDLITLLLEAGFSRVERATTDDADYVDSFFAFKD